MDGVFARVESEAFGELDGVSSGDWGAEAFDGGEDLFVEVPVDVGFEGRGRGYHVSRGICSFGG